MLPSSGSTKMFSGNLRLTSRNTGSSFCRLKIKFTIFCHSKAFLLQCGPHNAGRGSPWEWKGHALEMMETLKQIEHLIRTTIEKHHWHHSSVCSFNKMLCMYAWSRLTRVKLSFVKWQTFPRLWSIHCVGQVEIAANYWHTWPFWWLELWKRQCSF